MLCSAVLVVLALMVGGWVDARLSRHAPDGADQEQWLWVRWLVSAAITAGLAAGCFLAIRRLFPNRLILWFVPLLTGALLVAGAPTAAWTASRFENPKPLPRADLTAVTQLDVLVVTRGLAPSAEAPPPPPDRTSWDTRWSVAIAEPGGGLRVVLDADRSREAIVSALTGGRDDRAPRVRWRPGARHLILVEPYAIPAVVAGAGVAPPVGEAPSEPDPLARLAVADCPADTRVFVLLRPSAPGAVRARWQEWAEQRRGRVLIVGSHGAETLADVGFRAAVVAAEDNDDSALAFRFRPRLFFDSQASTREAGHYLPVNVDVFIETTKPPMCQSEGASGAGACKQLSRAAEIKGSYDYLDTGITSRTPPAESPIAPGLPPGVGSPPEAQPGIPSGLPPLPAGASALPPQFDCQHLPPGIPPPPSCATQSPLYWFVRRGHGEIYVGYWWFFPFNPTAVFRQSTCRPLTGIPNLACFDHASDWEGVTVVAEADKDGAVHPVAVIYEQHGKMLRRSWPWLETRWGDALQDERPLVYVASGSHASYPQACDAIACYQRPLHPRRPEGPYGGGTPWENNGDRCQWMCLLRLPVATDRQAKAALWNAFPGRWGRRVCILWDAVCAQTSAPRSPGHTDRFLRPWVAETRP